jgi:hypothetical protein
MFCRLVAAVVFSLGPAAAQDSTREAPQESTQDASEVLNYTVEWRLIEAGRARLTWSPTEIDQKPTQQVDLHLESAGLVSRLYRVDDDYRVMLTGDLCATSVFMKANEGRRRRETRITFDRPNSKIHYLERDLVKNSIVRQSDLDAEGCVHDVLGALTQLRRMKVEPPNSIKLPITDGKKFANAQIEAQEREVVKVPAGSFKAIRYEAYLFNGVVYGRKARLFVWLSDDEKKLPVQIRVRLGFAVGTITFQLTE